MTGSGLSASVVGSVRPAVGRSPLFPWYTCDMVYETSEIDSIWCTLAGDIGGDEAVDSVCMPNETSDWSSEVPVV